MEPVEKIDLPNGYYAKIHYDPDAVNPLKDHALMPILVLSEGAARRWDFGQDDDWCRIVNGAREEIAEKAWRWLRRRHPDLGYWDDPKTREQAAELGRHSSEMLLRYLRAFHDVVVILPVGIHEHSSTSVYLGAGPAVGDAAGWDSGHAGYWIVDEKLREQWGNDPDQTEAAARSSFEEFQSYVAGDVYGFQLYDGQGNEVDACWGYYGSESYGPDGYMREAFADAAEHDFARLWDEAHADAEFLVQAERYRHEQRVSLFKKLVAA